MNTESIIAQIDAEISKLQQAKTILGSISINKLAGRSLKKERKTITGQSTKRVMSAEGKAKIAAAQKTRWARVRKAAKKAS